MDSIPAKALVIFIKYSVGAIFFLFDFIQKLDDVTHNFIIN